MESHVKLWRLIGVPEAADLLGLKKSTLYRWVEEKRVPFVRIGRAVRFDRRALERWIHEHRVEPRE